MLYHFATRWMIDLLEPVAKGRLYNALYSQWLSYLSGLCRIKKDFTPSRRVWQWGCLFSSLKLIIIPTHPPIHTWDDDALISPVKDCWRDRLKEHWNSSFWNSIILKRLLTKVQNVGQPTLGVWLSTHGWMWNNSWHQESESKVQNNLQVHTDLASTTLEMQQSPFKFLGGRATSQPFLHKDFNAGLWKRRPPFHISSSCSVPRARLNKLVASLLQTCTVTHCCLLMDIIIYYSLLYASLLIVNRRNRFVHRRRHTSAWEHILELATGSMPVNPNLTVNGYMCVCVYYDFNSGC